MEDNKGEEEEKKVRWSGRVRKQLRKRQRKKDTKNRGIIFAQFLVDTFGLERDADHVIDVAGGT